MITDLSTGESIEYQRQQQVGWILLNLATMGRDNLREREKVKGVKGTSVWEKRVEGSGGGSEECAPEATQWLAGLQL